MTRQKKAVAFWDVLKHEKDLFMSFMKDTTNIGEYDSEFNSLHHEFNLKTAKEGIRRVTLLVDYIKSIKHPFDRKGPKKLINISTRLEVPDTGILLNTTSVGEECYNDFVIQRLQKRLLAYMLQLATSTNHQIVTLEVKRRRRSSSPMMQKIAVQLAIYIMPPQGERR